jgi:DNA replication ATP-dependent helicase Dna2
MVEPTLPFFAPDIAQTDRTLLEDLRIQIIDEAVTVEKQVHTIWQKAPLVRVADGQAIAGIEIVEFGQEGRVRLRCETNQSRFRAGDILCLNQGDPFTNPSIMVNLERDDETSLLIAIEDPHVNWGELRRNRTGWMLDLGYLDLSHLYLSALTEAGDTRTGRERILPLLGGRASLDIDPIYYEQALTKGEGWGLNWSQCEALAQAYASDWVYLIQGPPGTGKTRVLAHLVSLLVANGERVLVTSLTHRAINNALNKIGDIAPEVPTIKIG